VPEPEPDRVAFSVAERDAVHPADSAAEPFDPAKPIAGSLTTTIAVTQTYLGER
jgi:hypothetical protein